MSIGTIAFTPLYTKIESEKLLMTVLFLDGSLSIGIKQMEESSTITVENRAFAAGTIRAPVNNSRESFFFQLLPLLWLFCLYYSLFLRICQCILKGLTVAVIMQTIP